ncbi:MAG TPA: FAD-dependent oxidoreductase, partial [Candidatus Binatia bacterium]|nr:FAD-dependent oxidoreductase [Candidatus Binatia bacterium]
MASGQDVVLIVGAGLTGLSAAYFLGDRPYVLVEREQEVGGLCRSIREGGFTFDYTGHLLHMKRPEIRRLVFDLVGEPAFRKIDRRSGIYSHGTYTDYPFQVNTHGLPRAVIRECVMGFLETLQKPHNSEEDASFHDWALATFGPGICEHFMLPYNRKLLCTDLHSVTADWVSWSIPKPAWEDVVRGAQGTNRRTFGYNPSFLYPRAGGIDHLPRAFLLHVRPPLLSTAVERIHARERRAALSSGETVRYSAMISTIPLPSLIERIEDASPELEAFGRSLRYVSVLNLNLGFDAPSPQPFHWVYFPEEEFPFYRVGIYSNLSPASVPRGASAFYVEISHLPGEALDVARLTKE